MNRTAGRDANTSSPLRCARPAACKPTTASAADSSQPTSRASSTSDHGPGQSGSNSNARTTNLRLLAAPLGRRRTTTLIAHGKVTLLSVPRPPGQLALSPGPTRGVDPLTVHARPREGQETVEVGAKGRFRPEPSRSRASLPGCGIARGPRAACCSAARGRPRAPTRSPNERSLPSRALNKRFAHIV